MKQVRTQIGVTFLVGFVASSTFGGTPIVLVILMALLAAGALAWGRLDPKFALPVAQLFHRRTRAGTSAQYSPLALGLGHQARR